jgi:LysM repeat protein
MRPNRKRGRHAAPRRPALTVSSTVVRRGTSAALGAAALTSMAGSLLAPAHAAPGPEGPTTKVAAPSPIEGFGAYLPQVSCDPVEKPGVQAFRQMVMDHYKTGSAGSIARSCSVGGTSEHKEGRAWDWMLNASDPKHKEVADRFLEWLTAVGPDGKAGYNARRTGVMYVIWNKQIWSTYRVQDGWRPYTGASPHTDHIHLSFDWNGAMKRSSWWTGKANQIDYGPCVKVTGELAPKYTKANWTKCPTPAPAPKPPASTNPAPAPAPVPASSTTYKVVSGDTLGGIAKKYGTTVAAIKTANGLKSDLILVGQVLKVTGAAPAAKPAPAPAPKPAPAPAPKPAPAPAPKPAPAQTVSHKVVRGDTLGGIAKKYGTTVAALKSANGLKSDLILVGQVLKVPGKATTPAPKPAASTNAAPKTTQAPSAKPATSARYKVVRGDTLSHIAKRYGTTVAAIKSANKLRSDLILIGQVLTVPR